MAQIGVTQLGLLATSSSCWFVFNDNAGEVWAIPASEQDDYASFRVAASLVFAILASIFTVFVFVCLIRSRRKMHLVSVLLREATTGVMSMPALLMFPLTVSVMSMPALLMFPLTTTLFIFCIVAGLGYNVLYVVSSGSPVVDKDTDFVVMEPPKDLTFRHVQYSIVVLWSIMFVCGCQELITAGAIASWYFMEYKQDLSFPVLRSLFRLVRYHLGSVAASSLVALPVQCVDMWLYFTLDRLIDCKPGILRTCLLKTNSCMLGCYERLIKYLNRNTMIIVALHGWRYCVAAVFADNLFRTKMDVIGRLNTVTTFFLFLIKLTVVSIIIVVGTAWMKNNEDVCHTFVPLSLAATGSYIIANTFIGIYRVSDITLYLPQCVCVRHCHDVKFTNSSSCV
ncbi:Choline transporter-like protein 2 [Lamellibrachia satsuma]|nr:Choline transporter-like protein 2 [Lamellibrachia satsuma]